jgi:hypothetical protein
MARHCSPTRTHELASHLLGAAGNLRNEDVAVAQLLGNVALLLLGLSGPQRGRPKKDETLQALRRFAEQGSKRGAARDETGQVRENLRSAVRRHTGKPKPKKRGWT